MSLIIEISSIKFLKYDYLYFYEIYRDQRSKTVYLIAHKLFIYIIHEFWVHSIDHSKYIVKNEYQVK